VYRENIDIHDSLSSNIVFIVDSPGNEAAIVVAVPHSDRTQARKQRIIREDLLIPSLHRTKGGSCCTK